MEKAFVFILIMMMVLACVLCVNISEKEADLIKTSESTLTEVAFTDSGAQTDIVTEDLTETEIETGTEVSTDIFIEVKTDTTFIVID